jgi:hypothetical protein
MQFLQRLGVWAVTGIGVAAGTTAAHAQSVVYNNVNPLAPNYYPLADGEELADDVTLAGTNRFVTSFSVEVASSFAGPFAGTGSAFFYEIDPVTGLPEDQPFWAGVTALPGLIGENTVTWAVPLQEVPDSFVWSVVFDTTLPPAGPDEDFGVLLNDVPSVGTSDDFFFQRDLVGDWQAYSFTSGGDADLANFQATITAVPEPVTAGLFAVAAVAGLARRRRHR